MRHPAIITAAALCAAAIALTGCSTNADDPTPSNTQLPAHSAPAESSMPASSGTPSPDRSTSAKPNQSTETDEDPANIKWGSHQRIIPKTGPIKLPAPETPDAALETTFQIVHRYTNDSESIRNSGSTDISQANPYVTGRLLEQIKLESKEFKNRGIRSTGDIKLERILGQQDSYAGTGKIIGKNGKPIATKYSSVTLNLCVDTSDVKVTGNIRTPSETRRVFTAKSQYIPTSKTWTLSEYRASESGATC